VAKANGAVELRAIPKNGALKPAEVSSLLREKQLAIDEIYLDRGSLDDVFREITMSGAGK
jgi:ABC-2 type transport system ATP-binding protein